MKREHLIVLLVILSLYVYARVNRYEVFDSEGTVMVLDRWTSRVEARSHTVPVINPGF